MQRVTSQSCPSLSWWCWYSHFQPPHFRLLLSIVSSYKTRQSVSKTSWWEFVHLSGRWWQFVTVFTWRSPQSSVSRGQQSVCCIRSSRLAGPVSSGDVGCCLGFPRQVTSAANHIQHQGCPQPARCYNVPTAHTNYSYLVKLDNLQS